MSILALYCFSHLIIPMVRLTEIEGHYQASLFHKILNLLKLASSLILRRFPRFLQQLCIELFNQIISTSPYSSVV